jgi:hypothetical protein
VAAKVSHSSTVGILPRLTPANHAFDFFTRAFLFFRALAHPSNNLILDENQEELCRFSTVVVHACPHNNKNASNGS